MIRIYDYFWTKNTKNLNFIVTDFLFCSLFWSGHSFSYSGQDEAKEANI